MVCVCVCLCMWSITDSYRPLILGCVRVKPPPPSLRLHISKFIAGLLAFLRPSSKKNQLSHSPINDSLSYPRLGFNNAPPQKARMRVRVCACALESEWVIKIEHLKFFQFKRRPPPWKCLWKAHFETDFVWRLLFLRHYLTKEEIISIASWLQQKNKGL